MRFLTAYSSTCYLFYSAVLYSFLMCQVCGLTVDTLREYNFYHYEGSGYVPTYTRNDATDILHEAFGFRTDYQINGEKNMKKIIKNTKR